MHNLKYKLKDEYGLLTESFLPSKGIFYNVMFEIKWRN